MSDAKLRELERQAATGGPEAGLAYRTALARAGRHDEAFRLAYFAGDDDAGDDWTAERAARGLSVRQTGRTTRTLRRAVEAARRGLTAYVLAPNAACAHAVRNLLLGKVLSGPERLGIHGMSDPHAFVERIIIELGAPFDRGQGGYDVETRTAVFHDHTWDEAYPVPGARSMSQSFRTACFDLLSAAGGHPFYEWDEDVGPRPHVREFRPRGEDAFVPVLERRVRGVRLERGRATCRCGFRGAIVLADGRSPRPFYCPRCERRVDDPPAPRPAPSP